MINAAGGTAVAVRVDHTLESEVKALFGRIARNNKRLDILVNSIAGEDPLMGQWGHFWQANLKDADRIFRQALTSRIITAKHAALLVRRRRSGLIVEVTENDIFDWSVVPPPLGEVFRNGIDLELKWLTTLAARTRSFQKKIPGSG